jgi:hypothetical protein
MSKILNTEFYSFYKFFFIPENPSLDIRTSEQSEQDSPKGKTSRQETKGSQTARRANPQTDAPC